MSAEKWTPGKNPPMKKVPSAAASAGAERDIAPPPKSARGAALQYGIGPFWMLGHATAPGMNSEMTISLSSMNRREASRWKRGIWGILPMA